MAKVAAQPNVLSPRPIVNSPMTRRRMAISIKPVAPCATAAQPRRRRGIVPPLITAAAVVLAAWLGVKAQI